MAEALPSPNYQRPVLYTTTEGGWVSRTRSQFLVPYPLSLPSSSILFFPPFACSRMFALLLLLLVAARFILTICALVYRTGPSERGSSYTIIYYHYYFYLSSFSFLTSVSLSLYFSNSSINISYVGEPDDGVCFSYLFCTLR